jgi:predicted dehydrogenase
MTTRRSLTRRSFFGQTAAALLAQGVWTQTRANASPSPGQKLQIAAIGVANRANANVQAVRSEDLIALCDVDRGYLQRAREQFPDARLYADYRELLSQEADRLDAVVISTPDHHHAPAAIRALRAGLHVYCEKPLTHTVAEARLLTETARQRGLVTQLGTQIHAGDNYRRVVELVRGGAIGDISEVHAWVGGRWAGTGEPLTVANPPDQLSWDLWLGPAPDRPYAAGRYHPEQWRRWWDFGGGTLADMGCHYLDLAFWALELRYPLHCRTEGPSPDPQSCPSGITAHWDFPSNAQRGPVRLTWYDGDHSPPTVAGPEAAGAGVLFVGSEGELFADYGRYKLLPEEKFSGFKVPEQTLPSSPGHHTEWITAIKEGGTPSCDFSYSGPLTETVLLGTVAYRSQSAFSWDGSRLQAVDAPAANALIHKSYRPGWEVA